MVYNFFDKNSSGSGVKNEITPQQELAKELHKTVIRKFEKRKGYSSFKGNIQGADLANTQLISKCNKGFLFLLSVMDIYSKSAWVVPLKDKKGITITKTFQEILDEFGLKPSKIWEDKGSEFYNKLVKSFIQDDDIEMYSANTVGKSVVAGRFIRTLKNKIYK